MCGIFGLLLKSQARQVSHHANFSFRHLWNQLHTLKGRGPENTNLLQVSDSLIMGFQRLRIVDASPAGDQPLRRGNVSVIANAEIYNFQ
jgi:asparagine synthetase B (glutamine-hydrolysing)